MNTLPSNAKSTRDKTSSFGSTNPKSTIARWFSKPRRKPLSTATTFLSSVWQNTEQRAKTRVCERTCKYAERGSSPQKEDIYFGVHHIRPHPPTPQKCPSKKLPAMPFSATISLAARPQDNPHHRGDQYHQDHQHHQAPRDTASAGEREDREQEEGDNNDAPPASLSNVNGDITATFQNRGRGGGGKGIGLHLCVPQKKRTAH